MNWRKWLDEFVLASKGILLVSKEKRFWLGFIPTFLIFGTIMNLLSGGLSKFNLLLAVDWSDKFKIIGDAFIGIFGINRIFFEWLPVFLLCLLQGVLIGLIIFLWHKKRESGSKNSDNLEKAGIITGLIALGAGCPTCGTTLITPLIGAIFSSSSLAITGAVSTAVTIIATIVAILSVKRLGLETYAIIINEKYLMKKEQHAESH